MTDLLNADASALFCDTTTVSFSLDEPDPEGGPRRGGQARVTSGSNLVLPVRRFHVLKSCPVGDEVTSQCPRGERLSREHASLCEALSKLPLEEIASFSAVSSTNDIAKERLKVRSPVLVLAEWQERGRGRDGRSWESPPGGLWFSLGLRERQGNLSLVPILTGVAVAEGLKATGFEATVKWPNDILVDDRKVAGVLVEAEVRGDHTEVVVGIGVNANVCQRRLQQKVVGNTIGTLSHIAGHPVARDEILSHILTVFFRLWPLWISGQTDPVVQRWKELSSTLGREVTIRHGRQPGPIVGIAEDLAPDGALLVRDARGMLQRVVDGQITAQQSTITIQVRPSWSGDGVVPRPGAAG
ncbi:TPA: biotin--[acetyl-CoA-carboxylase] ligase [Candidatus Acetothermia bacterium]|nr:biotin--[acetyl-CoA-carboxylase] ligase [Candidatus Acetothermia bacterium]